MQVARQSFALFGERQLAHVRPQHRLVDDQARGAAEGLGELLVLLAERLAVQRFGQIEVAEDMSVARRDRHAEESLHRWVVGREAGRVLVLRQVVDAQRRATPDDLAEQSVTLGFGPDGRALLRVESVGDETREGGRRLAR